MNLYSLVSGLRFKLGMEILIFATDYFNSWCFSKPETGGLEILDSIIEEKNHEIIDSINYAKIQF